MEQEKLFALAKEQMPLMRAAFDYMLANPESGFREWKATDYLVAEYEKLGCKVTRVGDIPGFYTDIDTGRPGPKLLVLGELDGLPVPGHPCENPETHVTHACGHNAQSAALLGLAAVLMTPGVLDGLSGSIRLCGVPAEELVELDFREELRKQGTIHYYGGKQEFLRRGIFDDCDIAFMVHTGGKKRFFQINKGTNGCVLKTTVFQGKATHAASPSGGINALDAASLAISAMNALRTTFVDKHHVRVHPIITEAGFAVNSVPARVVMENQVRAADIDVVLKENARVNRACAAAAAAMGAKVHLCDRPGYHPACYNDKLCNLAVECFGEVVGKENALYNQDPMRWEMGCTDMSDLSTVMPAFHSYGSGAVGAGHSVDYQVVDFDNALVDPVQGEALLITKLLENDAAAAKDIKDTATAKYTKAEYLAYLDSTIKDVDAVTYAEDGSVILRS